MLFPFTVAAGFLPLPTLPCVFVADCKGVAASVGLLAVALLLPLLC